MKKNIIAIIPARGGSKGVPKKNLKILGNFPLIAYSIAAANCSRLIQETIVSTDSKEIKNTAIKFGGKVPFLRPKSISTDKSTDIEYVIHTIKWFKKNRGYVPLYWVILRPTTPLRNPNILDKAIAKIKKNKESTSLVSVHEVAEPPAKMFGMNGNYLHGLSPFDPRKDYYTLPRQEFPPTYFGNGYIDIIKTKTILKDNSFYGPRMLGYITQNIGEIDLPEDLKRLNYQIKKKNIEITKYLNGKYKKY